MKKWRSLLSADLDCVQRLLTPFLPTPIGVANGTQNSFDRHAYLSHQNSYGTVPIGHESPETEICSQQDGG